MSGKAAISESVPRLRTAIVYKQIYWPETNVLITRFLSEDGVAEIIDYMPVGASRDEPRISWADPAGEGCSRTDDFPDGMLSGVQLRPGRAHGRGRVRRRAVFDPRNSILRWPPTIPSAEDRRWCLAASSRWNSSRAPVSSCTKCDGVGADQIG